MVLKLGLQLNQFRLAVIARCVQKAELEGKFSSKIVAAINMKLDRFGDLTVILPDEEIHQHDRELEKKKHKRK